MAASLEMRIEPIRSLVAASIGATYTSIGTQLNKPTRMLIIQNETDTQILISLAAGDDHIQMQPRSQLIIDVCTNEVQNQGFFISKGTQIQAKYVSGAATIGAVYVTTFYARGT